MPPVFCAISSSSESCAWCLVIFDLRTQHTDALLLPLRLSSVRVEHFDIHVPDPGMVFEANCASLMRSRHSFLSSESVAGWVHYILRRVATAETFHFLDELFNLAGAVAQQPRSAGAAAETDHRQPRFFAGGVIPHPIGRHVQVVVPPVQVSTRDRRGALLPEANEIDESACRHWATGRWPSRPASPRIRVSPLFRFHSCIAALPHNPWIRRQPRYTRAAMEHVGTDKFVAITLPRARARTTHTRVQCVFHVFHEMKSTT